MQVYLTDEERELGAPENDGTGALGMKPMNLAHYEALGVGLEYSEAQLVLDDALERASARCR